MLKEGANEEAENLTGQRTVGRGSIAPSHHSCPACIGMGLRLHKKMGMDPDSLSSRSLPCWLDTRS